MPACPPLVQECDILLVGRTAAGKTGTLGNASLDLAKFAFTGNKEHSLVLPVVLSKHDSDHNAVPQLSLSVVGGISKVAPISKA